MGIFVRTLAAGAAAAGLASCATGGPKPDVALSLLEVTPAEATAGSSVLIRSAIRNAGEAGISEPVAVDIELVEKARDQSPVALLTGWETAPGDTLEPGETVADEANVRLPSNVTAGPFAICAKTDPDDRIAEAYEDNNSRCVPFVIAAGPPRGADLVIEKVTPLDYAQASRMVKVKIRNAGALPAGDFRIMAFKRSPRQPLLLIECPLTEGQLNAGSPASCPDLTQRAPLAPGEAAELTGYFAYVVANGASFIRQPINPNYRPPAVRRTIDFMVDGCFPPEDGGAVWCKVAEIDEINNFREATFKVR